MSVTFVRKLIFINIDLKKHIHKVQLHFRGMIPKYVVVDDDLFFKKESKKNKGGKNPSNQ